MNFKDLELNKQLQYGIDDLKIEALTPIQEECYPIIMSGKNLVGIAQTGTGKTFAYLVPILNKLKFSKQTHPRVLIMVPTRELVVQVVDEIKKLTEYLNLRPLGIYGGVNMNTQAMEVAQGADIVVATPGRLYDLAATRSLNLRDIKQLVIDEVDVMLDLGFRLQLERIFDLLNEKRQNIMLSATMTEEVEELIDDHFIEPAKVAIAVSGTPLDNIQQKAYAVQNFHTKVNLLKFLLRDKQQFEKVIIFMASRAEADFLYEEVANKDYAVIHSNKAQNTRLRTIEEFNEGKTKILIATDLIARGLDLDGISHVISFDTPSFPENYLHRIGRTGRAEAKGESIMFYAPYEENDKLEIESLMNYEIPEEWFPEEVPIEQRLSEAEKARKNKPAKPIHKNRKTKLSQEKGEAFHEKSFLNSKVNLGSTLKRKQAAKHDKPQRRGDKIQNMAAKKNKKKR